MMSPTYVNRGSYRLPWCKQIILRGGLLAQFYGYHQMPRFSLVIIAAVVGDQWGCLV